MTPLLPPPILIPRRRPTPIPLVLLPHFVGVAARREYEDPRFAFLAVFRAFLAASSAGVLLLTPVRNPFVRFRALPSEVEPPFVFLPARSARIFTRLARIFLSLACIRSIWAGVRASPVMRLGSVSLLVIFRIRRCFLRIFLPPL